MMRTSRFNPTTSRPAVRLSTISPLSRSASARAAVALLRLQLLHASCNAADNNGLAELSRRLRRVSRAARQAQHGKGQGGAERADYRGQSSRARQSSRCKN
jgi:hypothetical protein